MTMIERFGAVKVALAHRLGEVPIAESSVIVAASAPHRSAAIEVMECTTWAAL